MKIKNLKNKLKPRTILLVFSLVILSFFIYSLISFLSGKPLITISEEDLRNISKPPDYDPDKDAGLLYSEILNEFSYSQTPDTVKRFRWLSSNEPNSNELKEISNWLEKKQKALKTSELTAAKPYCWASSQDLFESDVLNFIYLGRAFSCRAFLSYKNNKTKQACSDIITCHKIGRHLRGPIDFVFQMAGFSLRGLSVNDAFKALSENPEDLNTINLFDQYFESEITKKENVFDNRYEKLLVTKAIQEVYTDNGKGDGHLIPRGTFVRYQYKYPDGTLKIKTVFEPRRLIYYPKSIWIAATNPGKKETLNLIEKAYSYLSKLSSQTPWQSHINMPTNQNLFQKEINNNFLLKYGGWSIQYNVREIKRAHYLRAKEISLATTIKILLYKLEKGHLPYSLNDLVSSGYLNILPMDPYSDTILTYKKIDDNFTLYSFGEDFDDDGGTIEYDSKSEDGDLILWPVKN